MSDIGTTEFFQRPETTLNPTLGYEQTDFGWAS